MMSNSDEWAHEFARQADADLHALELFEEFATISAAECHKLLFLQMACEKMCKAFVLQANLHQAEDVRTSHGFIRKHLPTIVKQEMSYGLQNLKRLKWAYEKIRALAKEIEILNPSMDRDNRPETCEYPWASGNKVNSPLDWKFEASQLLTVASGRTFLKILRPAINCHLKRS
jgi:hypothetical protein